jgi:epoxyqueuosine reductase QueG
MIAAVSGGGLISFDPELTSYLKSLAMELGADAVGVADLLSLDGIVTHPPDLLDGFTCAISVAINLGKYDGYNGASEGRAFSSLDKIAATLSEQIRGMGYRSLIVPPDKRMGRKRPLSVVGAISHKAAARAAGLGWIGRSTLLINPKFGPRICLVTLLTDMPLATDNSIGDKCGTCRRCIEACPAGAIADTDGHDDRESWEVLDRGKCGSYLTSQWRAGKICYECMIACPWGNGYAERPPDPDGMVQRLHNAWLGRQEGCRRMEHDRTRPRVLHYGPHLQVVEVCNPCYKTGVKEHRQLARILKESATG